MKILVAVALMGFASASNAACSLSDIKLTTINAKFVNRCSPDACVYLQGAAMHGDLFACPHCSLDYLLGY